MTKLRITEHKPHVVEYEIEGNAAPGFISFVHMEGVVYVGIKTDFDEVEECLTNEQARHLHTWLEKQLHSGPGIGMIR